MGDLARVGREICTTFDRVLSLLVLASLGFWLNVSISRVVGHYAGT